MEILTNPIVVSVVVMSVLCLLKMNVLFAILVAAIVAGATGGLAIDKTVSILIGGMGGNSETALSYKVVGTKKAAFVFLIAFVSCFSQNLIPVHIAFIPILIPPLLVVMNHMKLDRRAVACALTFGLKAPYVSLPVGFGLLFMTIIKDQMVANNVQVSISDISSVMWIGGVSMLIGLILSTLFYSRDREYKDLPIMGMDEKSGETEMNADCWKALAGAVAAFVAQLYFKSLPIGAMCGLLVLLVTGSIKWNKMDEMVDGGVNAGGSRLRQRAPGNPLCGISGHGYHFRRQYQVQRCFPDAGRRSLDHHGHRDFLRDHPCGGFHLYPHGPETGLQHSLHHPADRDRCCFG